MTFDMQEGYKKSKIGIIPEEWEVVRLGDNCDVRDGTHDSPKYVSKGIPFITSKNLSSRGLDFTDVSFITEKDHEFISKRSHVENGDILFGMIGTIGNPTIVYTSFEFSIKNVALLKFSGNQVLDNVYSLNVLKSSIIDDQFKRISNGGVQSFMALGAIRRLYFPLPPLPEQKKIAEILTSVDNTIESTRKVIEQTKKVKQGLLQELLTKGIGHTKFKQTNIGEIPDEWFICKLEKICQLVTDGTHHVPPTVSEGIPLIGAKNVNDKAINLKDCKYVSESTFDVLCRRVKPELNDILLTCIGSIGRVAQVKSDERFNIVRNVALIRANRKQVLPAFVEYCLESDLIILQIKGLTTATSQAALFLKDIRNLIIVLPPLSEQEKIIKVVSATDKQLEVLQKELHQIQQLKKGLMQDLLTGKVRVKV